MKQTEHAVTDPQASVVRVSAASAVKDVVNRIDAEHPDADIRVNERKQMWIDVSDAFEYTRLHTHSPFVRSYSRLPWKNWLMPTTSVPRLAGVADEIYLRVRRMDIY